MDAEVSRGKKNFEPGVGLGMYAATHPPPQARAHSNFGNFGPTA